MAEHGALTRGHVRARLIHDLAADIATRAALAKEYGVNRASITRFATTWRPEIEHARRNIEDQYAALWIADKRARVATHQQVVEHALDLLNASDDAPAEGTEVAEVAPRAPRRRGAGVDVSTAELMAKIQAGLRAVAEELGQLPNRVNVEHSGGTSVRYELHIPGFDVENLS